MPGPAGQHTLILQQERATKKVTGALLLDILADGATLTVRETSEVTLIQRLQGV